MVKQVSMLWQHLRRLLPDDLGQFAGGSAVSDPLGLLAVEREMLAAPPRVPDNAGLPAAAAAGDEHLSRPRPKRTRHHRWVRNASEEGGEWKPRRTACR
jgi:hypothetical protein